MGWFSNNETPTPQLSDKEIKDLESEARNLRAAQARVERNAKKLEAGGAAREDYTTAYRTANSFGSEASANESLVRRARAGRRGR